MPDQKLVPYAATLDIVCSNPRTGEDWMEAFVNFFDNLAKDCDNHPLLTIGHIKGFAKLGNEAGSCYYSTTGSQRKTNTNGSFHGEASQGQLDFNVLVYGHGIDKSLVEYVCGGVIKMLQDELQAQCEIRSLVNPPKK